MKDERFSHASMFTVFLACMGFYASLTLEVRLLHEGLSMSNATETCKHIELSVLSMPNF